MAIGECPELSNYYDVVIFSTKGSRSLASLLAGGGTFVCLHLLSMTYLKKHCHVADYDGGELFLVKFHQHGLIKNPFKILFLSSGSRISWTTSKTRHSATLHLTFSINILDRRKSQSSLFVTVLALCSPQKCKRSFRELYF